MKIDFFGVGVNFYRNFAQRGQPVRHLMYSNQDIHRIRKVLSTLGLLERCSILDDESDLSLKRNSIIKSFREFIDNSSNNRIFYFAGHGVSVNKLFHFCPSDFDLAIADQSSINISDLIAHTIESDKLNIFIFDCCRSPLKLETEALADDILMPIPLLHIHENVLIIFSSSAREKSYEATSVLGDGDSGGIFSYFLAKGFEQKISPTSSTINIYDLFDYAREQTSSFAMKNKRTQTPTILGPDSSKIYFILDEQHQNKP
jgi:hypothetical protein